MLADFTVFLAGSPIPIAESGRGSSRTVDHLYTKTTKSSALFFFAVKLQTIAKHAKTLGIFIFLCAISIAQVG